MKLADFSMPIGKVTKHQRKGERAKLGRLQDLIVKPGTLQRYHQHFNKLTANEFSLHDSMAIDAAAAAFIESLWEDGLGRSEASYLLAAIQYMVPTMRHSLPLSWRLVKT